jgi:hypothetical protein
MNYCVRLVMVKGKYPTPCPKALCHIAVPMVKHGP